MYNYHIAVSIKTLAPFERDAFVCMHDYHIAVAFRPLAMFERVCVCEKSATRKVYTSLHTSKQKKSHIFINTHTHENMRRGHIRRISMHKQNIHTHIEL